MKYIVDSEDIIERLAKGTAERFDFSIEEARMKIRKALAANRGFRISPPLAELIRQAQVRAGKLAVIERLGGE